MKIALTAWEDRISPVFDFSNTLLIVEIEYVKIKNKRYEHFNSGIVSRLAEVFNNFGVDVLICGAISEIPSN